MNSTNTIPGSTPVLSCAATAEFEKSFFAGGKNNEAEFMARAAKGIADETEALVAEIRVRKIHSVFVLAGKGHNAADALIAAQLLQERHQCRCKILLAQSSAKLSPAAANALNRLIAMDAAVRVWRDDADADAFLDGTSDLLLDGLLGYNFQAPLRPPFDTMIHWGNARADAFKVRVAVDLPSGMGDRTNANDPILRVDATIACGFVKAPLLEPENAALRGRLRLACIGFPNSPKSNLHAGAHGLFTLGPLRKLRPAQTDKRDFGHLFIVGGSRTMPGALLMNVRAALKAGVGLVTVFCPESVHAAFAAVAPEAMWIPWPETPEGTLALEGEFLLHERIARATALLCGSGMGDSAETGALLRSIVSRCECPLILDADALRNDILDAAKNRTPPAPVILLPHAGEFARIAPEPAVPARTVCKKFSAIIALKGSPTLVADEHREIAVCTGHPIFARGGSGDLLAGITGALFARHLHVDPLQTLAGAVAWHGAAADWMARRNGTESIVTTDILNGLAPVLREA